MKFLSSLRDLLRNKEVRSAKASAKQLDESDQKEESATVPVPSNTLDSGLDEFDRVTLSKNTIGVCLIDPIVNYFSENDELEDLYPNSEEYEEFKEVLLEHRPYPSSSVKLMKIADDYDPLIHQPLGILDRMEIPEFSEVAAVKENILTGDLSEKAVEESTARDMAESEASTEELCFALEQFGAPFADQETQRDTAVAKDIKNTLTVVDIEDLYKERPELFEALLVDKTFIDKLLRSIES